MKRLILATVIAGYAGLTSAVTFAWKAELTRSTGTDPNWCGIAVLAGAVSSETTITNGIGTFLKHEGWTQEDYGAQEGYTLLGRVDMGGASYKLLTERKVYTFSFDVGEQDAVTLIYFNQAHNAGQLHVISGLQGIDEDQVYDLGTWWWADSNAIQTYPETGPQPARGVVTFADPLVLPEPTVFALLAFGVAGLTLRRRA